MTPARLAAPTNSAQISSAVRRGSEWRKWDLHIHSPLSVLNNQFPHIPNSGPDWDAYLEALERVDVAVVGITDYFSIAGYREVLRYRDQGRLSNLARILPNVEFRVDPVVYSSKQEQEPRKINLHVIFSDEVNPDDIEHHFLRDLKFTCRSFVGGKSEQWGLTEYELKQLGARLKTEHPPFANRSDHVIGCMAACVRPEDISAVLDNKRTIFQDRYLIVLAETVDSELSWNGQDHLIRKNLVQGSHAIFSSNEGKRRWALGQRHLSADEFVKEFGSLKPCLHGSDAHCLDRIGKPAADRFCWIKADPTFEGLRHILYEPDERVYIGDAPPNTKNSYQVIEGVNIRNSPGWFGDVDIPLNADLACIIGGRGSGKSALAELIAYACGAFERDQKNEDTFLQRAAKLSPTNPLPISGAVVSLKWQDGHTVEREIEEDLAYQADEPAVRYLPQKFVERLCDPNNNQEIEEEIESVIFQRLDPTERLGASNFRELRRAKTEPIQIRRQNLERSVSKLNLSIEQELAQVDRRPEKQKDLEAKRAELQQLEQTKPEMRVESAADYTELERLQQLKDDLDAELATRNNHLNALESIRTRASLFAQEVASYNEEITEALRELGMETASAAFVVTFPNAPDRLISARRDEIAKEMLAIREGPLNEPREPSLKDLNAAIAVVKDQLKFSESVRASFEKYQADKRKLEGAIAALQAEIKEIDDVISPRIEQQLATRTERYLDLWALLVEERSTLEGLYDPLRRALSAGSETDRKLEFFCRIAFDAAAHAQSAMDHLVDSRKRGSFRDEAKLELAWEAFFRKIQAGDFARDILASGIGQLRAQFQVDDTGRSIAITDQLRQRKTIRDFDDWFYSTAACQVSYSLKFDGKELHLLSPGQKGIVLVLVYLEIDQDDTRPLIIDQPDDNLDSLSVCENLIAYFRKRKKSRQIVMITHNPNLVVNTDAEQILVARYDGASEPRIRYEGGALENVGTESSPGIRERACAVLEGGTDAFQRREQKYALHLP